jgi:hypothetical protein
MVCDHFYLSKDTRYTFILGRFNKHLLIDGKVYSLMGKTI